MRDLTEEEKQLTFLLTKRVPLALYLEFQSYILAQHTRWRSWKDPLQDRGITETYQKSKTTFELYRPKLTMNLAMTLSLVELRRNWI